MAHPIRAEVLFPVPDNYLGPIHLLLEFPPICDQQTDVHEKVLNTSDKLKIEIKFSSLARKYDLGTQILNPVKFRFIDIKFLELKCRLTFICVIRAHILMI